MPKKLGKKMKQIRESLGMSQREIVKALNYKDTPLRASQISQYETGQREPTMMLVLAYARLANVPMECLVDDKMKLR
ncbi:MAG TPA: helix-turn-helix transcriptional regulator [Pyrinomonadaceae bacterium]|nr:helix-turn-helix transcriptional regulator [Pyrinomonadaceae bacterium]